MATKKGQRRSVKPPAPGKRRKPAATPNRSAEPAPVSALSPETMFVLLEQIRGRVDQLHLRMDTLSARMDSFIARRDTREKLDDLRVTALEEEMQHLPGIIERSLRAVLNEAEGGGG